MNQQNNSIVIEEKVDNKMIMCDIFQINLCNNNIIEIYVYEVRWLQDLLGNFDCTVRMLSWYISIYIDIYVNEFSHEVGAASAYFVRILQLKILLIENIF